MKTFAARLVRDGQNIKCQLQLKRNEAAFLLHTATSTTIFAHLLTTFTGSGDRRSLTRTNHECTEPSGSDPLSDFDRLDSHSAGKLSQILSRC